MSKSSPYDAVDSYAIGFHNASNESIMQNIEVAAMHGFYPSYIGKTGITVSKMEPNDNDRVTLPTVLSAHAGIYKEYSPSIYDLLKIRNPNEN